MDTEIIDRRDYGIYYFANIIDGFLENSFPYARNLNDIYGEGNIQWYTDPFRKNSNFHEFIYIIVDSVFRENHNEYEEFIKYEKIYIEVWFEKYLIEFEEFKMWLEDNKTLDEEFSERDIDNYLSEVYDSLIYDELINKISNEVFFLMFSNRKIMKRFNELMADFFEMLDVNEVDEHTKKLLTKKGKIKRQYIPEWVKNAVYFRDRGKCVLCGIDLSNTLSRLNQRNYDHIVPLNLFGFNDVTNIQLLCRECNREKLDKDSSTSSIYEKWYQMD